MYTILYNPKKEVIRVNIEKYPYYRLALARRRCYQYLNGREYVAAPYMDIINNGGIGSMYAVITEIKPQWEFKLYQFFSYKDNKEIKKWIEDNPGRHLKPIVTKEEFELTLKYKGPAEAEEHYAPKVNI